MKRVLFVDDEPNVLDGLRRTLRHLRDQWQMEFASGGEQALALLQQREFDVVISDMRMPGIDGAELLSRVAKNYPATIRIILSGQSNQERVLRVVGPAHQFLSKPSDSQEIQEKIEAVCRLQSAVRDRRLVEVTSRIESLPSLPYVFCTLVKELQRCDPDLPYIASLISNDIAMTAKVMQLVNSSFFGLSQRFSSPLEAVTYLGLERIRPLALSACIFSQLSSASAILPWLDELTDHSLMVGLAAQRIAERLGAEERVCEEAFLAGMLHNVGKLILMTRLTDEYNVVRQMAKQSLKPECEIEREVIGTSHAELGGYILSLWGLSQEVVAAAAWHHTPTDSGDSHWSLLSLVHVADAYSASGPTYRNQVDKAYLSQIGELENVAAWQEAIDSLWAEEALR